VAGSDFGFDMSVQSDLFSCAQAGAECFGGLAGDHESEARGLALDPVPHLRWPAIYVYTWRRPCERSCWLSVLRILPHAIPTHCFGPITGAGGLVTKNPPSGESAPATGRLSTAQTPLFLL